MFTELAVHGDDARSFLQSQLTQDIDRVTPSASPLAAWCNPQGRVIALMRVRVRDDGFGLILLPEIADEVKRQLLLYRLRSRVQVENAGDTFGAIAVHDDNALAKLEDALLVPAGTQNSSCTRNGVTTVRLDDNQPLIEVYGASPAVADLTGLTAADALPESSWRGARLAAGIADTTTATSGIYTPHMLNLDRLGAVSFTKGCYPGQEIVARTQHRGASKRRLKHYRAEGDFNENDKLAYDNKEIGEIVCQAGRDLLALTPVETHDAILTLGQTRALPVAPG
ncbi:MAG: hypothetical protein WD078_06270 [Woeseia sp.]